MKVLTYVQRVSIISQLVNEGLADEQQGIEIHNTWPDVELIGIAEECGYDYSQGGVWLR